MTWFLTFVLCCAAGGFRYIEGASKTELPFKKKVPSAVWRVSIGLCAIAVVWLSSSQIVLAVLVGLISAITISAGYTNWKDAGYQFARGLVPCMIGLPLIQWVSINPLTDLAVGWFIACYIMSYVVYVGVGHWWKEVHCRFVQGALICSAGIFL